MPPKPKIKPSLPTKSSAFSASTLTSSNRRISSCLKTRSGTRFTLPSPSPPSSPSPSEVLSDEDSIEIDGLDEALGHIGLLVERLLEFFDSPARALVPFTLPLVPFLPPAPYDSLVLLYEEVMARTRALEASLLGAQAQILALSTTASTTSSTAIATAQQLTPDFVARDDILLHELARNQDVLASNHAVIEELEASLAAALEEIQALTAPGQPPPPTRGSLGPGHVEFSPAGEQYSPQPPSVPHPGQPHPGQPLKKNLLKLHL